MHNSNVRIIVVFVIFFYASCTADSVVFLDRPSAPIVSGFNSARSWTPISRGTLVFPPSSNTNAGRLNYQLQDAEKHKPRSDETWAVQLRPQKALYFPDGTKIPSSQSLRSESQSNSGFRPSPEYSVAVLNDDPIKGKRENPTLSNLSKESGVTNQRNEALPKTTSFVITDIVPSVKEADVTPSPILTDYNDLVDAMEQLVEKINELELKVADEKTSEEIDENSRSISEIKSLFLATKHKFEMDMTSLSSKAVNLEQRLSTLEEITREWIDPNILEQEYSGKSNGKRGAARSCPVPFFSLDDLDATAPCYFISSTPNFRKNWQDAASSCQEIQAKLVEPKSTDELAKLTDYLRVNRTEQLGGGYWTGGLNPGLMWLWPNLGISLTNIDPEMWLATPDATISTDTISGKCLRLSYDRSSQRYALQGSDCQRYLYFVCEYDANVTTSTTQTTNQQLNSPLFNQRSLLTSSTVSPLPSITSTIRTTTTRRSFKIARTSTEAPLPPPPPTPNYVGVIGFKGISQQKQTNDNPLNLAVLENSNF